MSRPARPPRPTHAILVAAALVVALAGCASSAGVPATGPAGPASSGDPEVAAREPLAAPMQPTSSPLARPTAAQSQDLAKAVAYAKWKYGLPGVSVAIAYADGSVWTGHAGVADVKKKTPVKASTAFAFGSITKTFTAALVLRLAEEGLLGLDDPVLRWLPGYASRAFLGTTPARRQLVTVRMLLAQTSGLYDYFDSLPLDAKLRAAKKRVWAPDEVLDYVLKPLFIAGDGWAYANTNYLLLGLIAERAGGAPLATLYHSRLLDPAGLHSLYLQISETTKAALATGYDFATLSRTAKPIPWSDGTRVMPFTSVTSAAGAAGALAGTAADLARWGQAVYAGSALQPVSQAAMLAFDGTAAAGAPADYGLGVGRRYIGERLTVGHAGRLAGFRSSLRYVPELGVSVAVLTNQDRRHPDRVVEALLDVIDPPAPQPTPTPSPSGASTLQPDVLPPDAHPTLVPDPTPTIAP